MKAVFHINDCCKWKTTFNSSLNACAAAQAKGREALIYIVANGEAVEIMTASEGELAAQRKRLQEAAQKNIRI